MTYTPNRKAMTARKDYKCKGCKEGISKGTTYACISGVNKQGLRWTNRYHLDCNPY